MVYTLAGAIGDDPTFVSEQAGCVNSDVSWPNLYKQLQDVLW
jgi:hypothetical protein